jgi:hypothetical protein
MDNYLCKCSHLEESHGPGVASKQPLCYDCMDTSLNSNVYYHEFRLDGLKYLEQRYEEKVK